MSFAAARRGMWDNELAAAAAAAARSTRHVICRRRGLRQGRVVVGAVGHLVYSLLLDVCVLI